MMSRYLILTWIVPGQPIPNVDAAKVLTVCHESDTICKNGVWIWHSHLTYAKDAKSAAYAAIS